jgi:hypothetical protein
MKRLICSAAVASALLAATAIPSRAATIGLFGMSTETDTIYDDTYMIHVSTPGTVMISGGEFNIADFSISGPISLTFSGVTPTVSTTPAGTGEFFSGSASLGTGNYSFVVTGTGTPATPFGYSSYGGSIHGADMSISPVPIPGALALFASGLGLLGFWGWTKRRKAGLGSASLEAAAC